jgi:putative ABC transport system permease protein
VARRPSRVALPILSLVSLAATPAPLGPGGSGDVLPSILLTRQLAESLKVRPGDVVRLSADPSGKDPRPFRVVGGNEPTPDPMRLTSERLEARLHLPDLIALSGDDADSVSAINIALVDPLDGPSFARDLQARMPALVARPTAPQSGEDSPFIVLKRFHVAIAVVTVFASTIFLLALMVMLVEERRETIGVLRLIGLRRRRILLQVFVEGVLLSAGGAVAGTLLALVSQGAFNRFFQWRYDTALVFVRVTPEVAWQCLALAIPLGMLASLVASWGLLRRQVWSLARR